MNGSHPAQVRRDSLTVVKDKWAYVGGHGERAVPPLGHCGSAFVEVNAVTVRSNGLFGGGEDADPVADHPLVAQRRPR